MEGVDPADGAGMPSGERSQRRQPSYVESLRMVQLTWDTTRYRQSSHSVLTLGFAAMGAILGYSHAVRRNRAAGTEEAGTSEP